MQQCPMLHLTLFKDYISLLISSLDDERRYGWFKKDTTNALNSPNDVDHIVN